MKQIAILLAAVMMLAGCSGAAASSQPPVGYVDSNPNMVFSTLKSGDITYEGYRLFIDVTELSDRTMAKKDLALGVLLTKDLQELGVEIDEITFRIDAASEIMQSFFSDSNMELIEHLREASGLTQEQMISAMIEIYRPQYLMSLMLDYQREKIKAELPADNKDPDEVAAEKASEVMKVYYEEVNTRCDYSDPTLLVTLDGEAIALTEEHVRFMDYVATIYRADLLARLQAGVAIQRELTAKENPIDMEIFEPQCTMQIDAFLADSEKMTEIDGYLAVVGATREEYFASYRKFLLGEYAGPIFVSMLEEEYAALPADSPDRPETFEEYYYKRMNNILDGAALVNINGRA
jgi:hypothetical protein